MTSRKLYIDAERLESERDSLCVALRNILDEDGRTTPMQRFAHYEAGRKALDAMSGPQSRVLRSWDAKDDLLSWGWTILANVSGGNWEQQADEWITAVTKWRDQYHAQLPPVLTEDQVE